MFHDAQDILKDSHLSVASICYVPADYHAAHPRIAHGHDDRIEFQIAMKGSGECIVDGIPYYLRAGDVLIVDSGAIHDEIPNRNLEIDTLVISFRGLRLPGFPENCMLPEKKSPLIPAGAHSKQLMDLAMHIYEFYVSEDFPGKEDVCKYLVSALFMRVQLLLAASPEIDPEQRSVNEAVETVKNYIDTHYMEELSLESLAELVHLSAYYLSHIYKDATNFSPIQYLNRRRLGEAESLLTHSDLSVSRIALEVGYGTINNFNNSFLKYIGISPAQYRKSHRNIEMFTRKSSGKR